MFPTACCLWRLGGCFNHALKNLVLHLMAAEMSSCACPGPSVCTHLPPGKSHCKNEKGARWDPDMAGKVGSRVLVLLKAFEKALHPELQGGRGTGRHGRVGGPERVGRLRDLKTWLKQQLVALLLHLTGDHCLCEHGPLPQVMG